MLWEHIQDQSRNVYKLDEKPKEKNKKKETSAVHQWEKMFKLPVINCSTCFMLDFCIIMLQRRGENRCWVKTENKKMRLLEKKLVVVAHS